MAANTLERAICAVAAVAALAAAAPAQAEKWLKIMPDDPYATEGVFHLFDIDSAFEDRTTGYVAARMIYVKPAEAGSETKWLVWAFDCKGSVYYVSNPGDAGGTKADPDWRTKANKLDTPVMGGVTNMFGEKLCALKGSWPKDDLP